MSVPEHPEVPESAGPASDKPPHSNRCTPLSLRIFMYTLLALGAAGIVFVGIPAYRQYTVIREVERLGAYVSTVKRVPDWRARWNADWMRAFDEVDGVGLAHTSADDETLRHLR